MTMMVFLLSDTVIKTAEHQLITERIIKNSDCCEAIKRKNGLSIKEVMFISLSDNFFAKAAIGWLGVTSLFICLSGICMEKIDTNKQSS